MCRSQSESVSRNLCVLDIDRLPDAFAICSIYKAAAGLQGEKGISLRFPRFIRLRDDKDADDITTAEQASLKFE